MTIRPFVQHFLNPLHVFCRLSDWGLGKRTARGLSAVYERVVYKNLMML